MRLKEMCQWTLQSMRSALRDYQISIEAGRREIKRIEAGLSPLTKRSKLEIEQRCAVLEEKTSSLLIQIKNLELTIDMINRGADNPIIIKE